MPGDPDSSLPAQIHPATRFETNPWYRIREFGGMGEAVGGGMGQGSGPPTPWSNTAAESSGAGCRRFP